MQRSKSVFEMFPETLKQLEIDLQHEGSDLAGVNAEFTFTELPMVIFGFSTNFLLFFLK